MSLSFSSVYRYLLTLPSMLLARTRPSRYLPGLMFLWGVVTIGMAFIKDYKDLIIFRIVIGCLEAGFAPGVLLLLSSWYRKEEQSKRFAVYISASILSGAFGGLMAGAIQGSLDGKYGIAGWRWLFIVEGAMTAGWSFCATFLLLDFPATKSRKLNEQERALAILRIQAQHKVAGTEDQPRLSHKQALVAALRNWKTWAFTVGYMVSSSSVFTEDSH